MLGHVLQRASPGPGAPRAPRPRRPPRRARVSLRDGRRGASPRVPRQEAHAKRHAQVIALLEAHVACAFEVTDDQLFRTSPDDDLAPDVSVYPDAPDPATDDQIPELAFEVVSTQQLGDAAVKAAKFAARGVRRVFAIDIPRSRALEWSDVRAAWIELDPAGQIVDPALGVPLPIDALVHAASTKDPVARALVAQRNPVFEAVRATSRAEGKIEGKIEALFTILAARDMAIDGATRQRIRDESDPHRLDRWLARAAIATSSADVVTDD